MTGKLVKSLLCISTVALLLAGCGKSEEVGGTIPPQPVARERASSEAAAPAAHAPHFKVIICIDTDRLEVLVGRT